jgi:hypothetical protein
MKFLNQRSHYLSMFALFAIACSSLGGSGAGDTLVQLKVSSDPSSTTIGNALTVANVEYTVAKVVVSEIEFELAQNCELENEEAGELNYEGPFVVNLLNQKAIPSFDEIKLTDQKYCKFKFKLDQLESDEIPSGVSSSDPIVDLSVYIEGIYNSATPFIVKLDRNEEFELDSETSAGFSLTSGKLNTVFLVFDLSKLFEGIDLSTLTQDAGVIYIDKDNNDDAFDTLKDNLKAFSKLQKDSNEDDSLDDNDDVIANGVVN